MSRDISEHETRVFQALKASAEIAEAARRDPKKVNVESLMWHQLDQLAEGLSLSDWRDMDRPALVATIKGRLKKEPRSELMANLEWMTNLDIAEAAGVAERTARKHTSRLATQGVIEHDPSYPAHAFRFNPETVPDEAKALVSRLDLAMSAYQARRAAK